MLFPLLLPENPFVDSPLILLLTMIRNLDERSTPVNISYSNDRTLPRSCKKGAPSPEKTEKASSCSVTATGEKLNGSIEQAVPMNVESVAHPEPETAAAAEKRNLDQLEWPRICISLSRKEKEYDFLIMKGTKLPQRPKKRAKNVDRSLQVRRNAKQQETMMLHSCDFSRYQ